MGGQVGVEVGRAVGGGRDEVVGAGVGAAVGNDVGVVVETDLHSPDEIVAAILTELRRRGILA